MVLVDCELHQYLACLIEIMVLLEEVEHQESDPLEPLEHLVE